MVNGVWEYTTALPSFRSFLALAGCVYSMNRFDASKTITSVVRIWVAMVDVK